jgi:hypothetical protein
MRPTSSYVGVSRHMLLIPPPPLFVDKPEIQG